MVTDEAAHAENSVKYFSKKITFAICCHRRECHNHKRILFTCFTVLFRLVRGVRPACDISPGDLLESTTITCFFPGELGQSGFKVIHLDRNESDSCLNTNSGKENCPLFEYTIVIAKWDNDQYMYSLDDGFSMQGQQPTSHITFSLNWITRNHTGTYACVPDGNSHRNVGTCTLSLNSEKPKESTVRTATIDNGSENDCESSRAIYMVATAVFCVLFFIAVIIVIAYVVYRKCKTRQRFKAKKARRKAQEENYQLDEKECAPEIS